MKNFIAIIACLFYFTTHAQYVDLSKIKVSIIDMEKAKKLGAYKTWMSLFSQEIGFLGGSLDADSTQKSVDTVAVFVGNFKMEMPKEQYISALNNRIKTLELKLKRDQDGSTMNWSVSQEKTAELLKNDLPYSEYGALQQEMREQKVRRMENIIIGIIPRSQ